MKIRRTIVLSILLPLSFWSRAFGTERPIEPEFGGPVPAVEVSLNLLPANEEFSAESVEAPVVLSQTKKIDSPAVPVLVEKNVQTHLVADKKSFALARKSSWTKVLSREGKEVSSAAKNLGESASDASVFSAGRRIWDIVSGRRKSQGVLAAVSVQNENPADFSLRLPSPSSLTPSPKRDGDARPSALTAPSSLTPSPKRDGDARPSALTAPLDAEQILAELRARPPSAVFFDYDKTLTEVNEKGISFPPARNLVEGIKTLLKRGWPVAIITSRTFDRQPASANFANTIEPLISQIPESLRDHLFFVGGAGSEFIAFNKKGKPVRYLDRDWSDDEKAKIASIIDDTLSELKVSPDEVNISRDLPSQMLARFNAHGDPRSTPFAELLDKKLKERGLLFPVIHGGDFVYFNKFDKGMGAALIYSAMRQKGFSVSEDNLLFVGDEFHMFPNGTMGGDAKMALAFPKSLAITVGKDMRGALPPSVLWLGGRTSGTDLVMRELLKMPAPRLNGVLSKKTKYLAGASFAVGGLGGILLSQPAWVHFLHHPMAVLGMAGTSLLSAVAIPQIVKNFKLKALATKNLSLMTNLGWAAVSALFLALSLIKHSSPFWVSSNLAGLLENSVLVSQILMYNQKGMRGALGVLPVAAVTAAAIFGGISFPTVLFGAAIGLLTVSSIPQIVANFKLYRAEGKSPEGLSPLLPALALAGSILSLAVAVSQGNIYWILTNSVAIVMSALILAQIYAPGRANSILAKALFPRR